MFACMAATDPRVDKINALLAASGKSVRWLARQVRSTDTTIGHVLSGETKNPRDETLIDRMAEALDQVPNIPVIGIGAKMMRQIPVYASIMAGEPGDFTADVEWELIPEWGGDFERWARVIRGDSMLPLLRPGDRAVFENRRHESGNVVHAFKDGDDVIKAYREIDGGQKLCSFNAEGPTLDIEGWSVKGICVMRIRYSEFGIRSEVEFPGGLSWAMRELNI